MDYPGRASADLPKLFSIFDGLRDFRNPSQHAKPNTGCLHKEKTGFVCRRKFDTQSRIHHPSGQSQCERNVTDSHLPSYIALRLRCNAFSTFKVFVSFFLRSEIEKCRSLLKKEARVHTWIRLQLSRAHRVNPKSPCCDDDRSWL